ncbi:bacillithiol biosynthesis cysteine-adding enzyme BshC [Wenyingzhuangia sp. IMCC45574]
MENTEIPYKETGFFSKLVIDYLDQKETISSLYNRFPSIENFEGQIQEKSNSFPLEHRKVLVEALEKQYKGLKVSSLTQEHIDNLVLPNTFTITTGHQLNLFSGPLYFLYKIISVLNLCKELKQAYPKQNFVPVYWMASEDHDFEEIQYFNFKGKKVKWERESGGAVGRLSTEGLDKVFEEFSNLLNSGSNADALRSLFKKAYLEHDNLGAASRYLVNHLFGDKGLVVIDGDDQSLKSLFKPYALKELKEELTYQNVSKTNVLLNKEGYKIQVNPRKINLFYIGDGFRERIIKEGTTYKVNNTELSFDSAEELFANTDKLEFVSGNALLRPLYQEVILPNLCYIGGGGELAYWLQLKSTFNNFNVPFPVLLLRNSALLMNEKQQKKIQKLGLTTKELFLPTNDLIKAVVKKHSELNFNFNDKRKELQTIFSELRELTKLTDKSFVGAVNAQEVKQLKGLANLEKRLLKAEKKKMYDVVSRAEIIQRSLFPNQSLQERQANFSEFYELIGDDLIAVLSKNLSPLVFNFLVIPTDS